MKFSVIDPSAGSGAKVPVIYWLSGLTCTDRNFIEKAGAFEAAAKHSVLIVCPDTSPRGVDIEGDSDAYDFGKGAGFYLNATEAKWAGQLRFNARPFAPTHRTCPAALSIIHFERTAITAPKIQVYILCGRQTRHLSSSLTRHVLFFSQLQNV